MNTASASPRVSIRTALTIAILLLASVASRLSAQATLAARADIVLASAGAGSLRSSYQVHLLSDWPQYFTTEGCANGGQEEIEGRLIRSADGGYTGVLHRTATILFCGDHGASAEGCSVKLTTDGQVAALGTVARDQKGAGIALRWKTSDTPTRVALDGNCSPELGDKLKQMYLSTSHSLEFALPFAGEGARSGRLDDYGWVVEIR